MNDMIDDMINVKVYVVAYPCESAALLVYGCEGSEEKIKYRIRYREACLLIEYFERRKDKLLDFKVKKDEFAIRRELYARFRANIKEVWKLEERVSEFDSIFEKSGGC